MVLRYIVPSHEDNLSLREVLARRLCLSTAQRLACQQGEGILVDGRPVRAHTRLAPGAVVTVALPLPNPMDVPVESPMGLCIVYEDEALLVCHKPAGMLVHPSHAQYQGTLLSGVLGYLQQTQQPLCAHPVHRLDRGTSGIVVFAKHPHVQARWMDALQAGAVEKTYEALTLGTFPDAQGDILLPIAREQPQAMRRVIRSDGAAAHTRYAVVSTFALGDEVLTHVRFQPMTGRTHQLRVHSAALGCPLLGDRLYGTEASVALSTRLGLENQLLHAAALALPHPLTGERLHIACLDHRLEEAISALLTRGARYLHSGDTSR